MSPRLFSSISAISSASSSAAAAAAALPLSAAPLGASARRPIHPLEAARRLLGAGAAAQDARFVSSGLPELDALLGGGFPRGALTEILSAAPGRGEMQMILAAAASLGRALWVLPSSEAFGLSAPAMEAAGIDLSAQLFCVPRSPDGAFRTAVRAAAEHAVAAVAAWLPPLASLADRRAMQQLALAASSSGCTVFALRPAVMSCCPSAAALRIQIAPAPGATAKSVIRATHPQRFLRRTAEAAIALYPMEDADAERQAA